MTLFSVIYRLISHVLIPARHVIHNNARLQKPRTSCCDASQCPPYSKIPFT